MTVDTRGRRAAQAVVKAAERLGPAPELGGIRRRMRRRTAIRAGVAGLALILAAAVLWPRLTPPGEPEPIRPAPVLTGVPGMDRRVRDAIPTGQTTRTDLAVGPDAVWVLNRNRLPGQDLLVRVDPATDRVVARIPVGGNAIRVTVGEGSVWVLRSSPERADLVQVDPARNLVVGARQVWATSNPDGSLAEQLVVAGGSACFVAQPGLVRYDLRSNAAHTVLAASRYSPLNGLAAAGDSIWVGAAGSVLRVRLSDAAVLAPVNLAALGVIPIDGLATGGGELWVFGYGQAVRSTRAPVGWWRRSSCEVTAPPTCSPAWSRPTAPSSPPAAAPPSTCSTRPPTGPRPGSAPGHRRPRRRGRSRLGNRQCPGPAAAGRPATLSHPSGGCCYQLK